MGTSLWQRFWGHSKMTLIGILLAVITAAIDYLSTNGKFSVQGISLAVLIAIGGAIKLDLERWSQTP